MLFWTRTGNVRVPDLIKFIMNSSRSSINIAAKSYQAYNIYINLHKEKVHLQCSTHELSKTKWTRSRHELINQSVCWQFYLISVIVAILQIVNNCHLINQTLELRKLCVLFSSGSQRTTRQQQKTHIPKAVYQNGMMRWFDNTFRVIVA